MANKLDEVTSNSPVGTIGVKTTKDGKGLYFQYMGAGGQVRSDLIDISQVSYLKKTLASELARPLLRTKLVLDKTINEGLPISGQEYLTRVLFMNYLAPGEAHQMVKHGVVQAYKGMTASEFYKTMALSLVKNFSRGEEGLLKFYLEIGGTLDNEEGTSVVEVTKKTKVADLSSTYTGIIFDEVPQDWKLGVMSQDPVNYTVHPTTVADEDGFDRIWGIASKIESKESIKNGKKIADLEYFLMGERGDQYRNIGWPHVIETKYLADPSKEYDVIDIHYAFQGPAEDIQKSPKDITIVVPTDASGVAASIYTAIENAVNGTED